MPWIGQQRAQSEGLTMAGSPKLPIHDARRVPDGARLEYDVVVVGTGVAGVIATLRLARPGLRLAVLESGGDVADIATTALYDLRSSRRTVDPVNRRRWLGGTSNAWTGGKSTLDAIDLAVRWWVPGSGWPLAETELRDLYRRAARMVGRHGPSYYDGPFTSRDGVTFDGGDLRTVAFHNDREPLRFGEILRAGVAPGDGVDLFCLANVTEVLVDDDGMSVAGVRVETLTGRSFTVGAPVVVVSCGAIENARLLLASRSRRPAGLGNGGDLVGRYYQDHPKGFTGEVDVARGASRLPASLYWGRLDRGGRDRWGVGLSPEAQERHEVLNSYVRLDPVIHDVPPPGLTAARRLLHGRLRAVNARDLLDLPGERQDLARVRRFRRGNEGPIDTIRVRSFLEQEPRPENRVRLDDRLDRFGQPLAVVDWDLSELDRRSVRILHEVLGTEFVRTGIGRVRYDLDDASPVWDTLIDAAHHAGTTRMGSDRRTSVTDPWGEVHEVRGLFVNGASLFPTSGYANPVFTIMALALRVADRVADRVAPGPSPHPVTTGRPRIPVRPTPLGLDETRRWASSRRRALRPVARATRGHGVVWTAPRTAELAVCEVPEPGPGQISVLVEASAVSPGTERATWLGRPGAEERFPHLPGYSLSGTVVSCGPGVHDLEPGAAVAVWGAPHRSIVTIERSRARRLPVGADWAQASLVTLGAIAMLGVTRCGPLSGTRVAVVGAGPIGLLAQRLAAADGAASTVVLAASSAKDRIAGAAGAEVLRPADADRIRADVVIEATGELGGFELALRAAREGGIVVLLGTTRSRKAPLPVHLLRHKQLRIVGAHMGILDRGHEGLDRAGAADRFLTRWESGSVPTADLVTHRVDPRDAPTFYRQLAHDRTIVVATFDWWHLPDSWRRMPGPLLVPNPYRLGRAHGTVADSPAASSGVVVEYPEPGPAAVGTAPPPPSSSSVLELLAGLDPGGPVRIVGPGPLSDQLRAALGDRAAAPAGQRSAIVIGCGLCQAEVEAELAQLDDRSVCILVSPPADLELDLQRQVHRSGATVLII